MNYRQFYGLMNIVEEELIKRDDRIGTLVFRDYWDFRTQHKDAIMHQDENSTVPSTLELAIQPFLKWYYQTQKNQPQGS